MSCYVRGNAAVSEVKLYFSVKGVFFSCQQAWLHQPLLDSPPNLPISTPHPSDSYLELYRGQIEGIIFLGLNFSAMQ